MGWELRRDEQSDEWVSVWIGLKDLNMSFSFFSDEESEEQRWTEMREGSCHFNYFFIHLFKFNINAPQWPQQKLYDFQL